MKEDILEYIKKYNAAYQIKIEYAVLEPFLNAKGDPIYNLHFVFSPKKEYLLRSYLSGQFLEGALEKTVPGASNSSSASHAHGLMLSFPMASGVTEGVGVLKNTFDNIVEFTLSNITRFYNFKFSSPTDPFLSMFLEQENIIFISPEFKEAFFDKKEEFKPHAVHMLHSISDTFAILTKQASDYQVYSDKAKMTKVLDSLHKTMKLYFIALRYHTNKELVSSFEEKHVLILNTLVQASRPWEFVNECSQVINNIKREINNTCVETNVDFAKLRDAEAQKALLKQESYAFLNKALIGEIDAERNRNS